MKAFELVQRQSYELLQALSMLDFQRSKEVAMGQNLRCLMVFMCFVFFSIGVNGFWIKNKDFELILAVC